MQVIDEIANLILENPLITAQAIARRLGYAEEKTVYYWIHKAHYSGLNAFKMAVLHGQFFPHHDALEESPSLYGRLPICEDWTSEGKPVFNGETMAIPGLAPAELIWRYSGYPVLSIVPSDLLVLSPIDVNRQSLLMVCLVNNSTVELRATTIHATHVLLLHPTTLQRDNKSRPLYQIQQLIRHY